VPIGLDEDFIEAQRSDWKLSTEAAIRKILRPRLKFSHKGTYGHVLLFAGNSATMGAALLSAGACLHAGAGLITAAIPPSGMDALNAALPEAMILPRNEVPMLSAAALGKFSTLAIGPGLGITADNEILLASLIDLKRPLLLDADAITILSDRADLMDKLPKQSIITPHVKEFDRLFVAH
jgi:NAD(P)H-hydrate epimerase